MEYSVDEFTSLTPITINLNAALNEALKLMQQFDIRHLPVLEDRFVVGIISERDLLANFGKPWSEQLRVKDIMCTSILSVYKNENLGEVSYRLSKEKKGSAIVLDDDGSLYGIFTTTDALNALVELTSPEANAKSVLKEVMN